MGDPCDPKNPTMHRADWVTLRDYVDARFSALCAEMAKGDEVMNARLASMNEFRAALSDQSKSYITREEAAIQHKVFEDEIRESRDFRATHAGKASLGSVLIAYGLAIISMLVGIVLHFLK